MTSKILYVDDEADIRELACFALELDSDFDVRDCGSGADALELVADWRPDLVLLDVMMPAMDGPTTLARLREGPGTMADVPVVFITARTQTAEVEHLRSLGAVGVIGKPFDPMTLAGQVRAFLP
ncbi:response regulator [Sphingomonas ginkgonis]|uniref:Response regulator n=1 Tax=Sphingomonas ginkgonis TaxID=2315330 RepID=A0A3S0EM55_9SPHN|nr:response regulator [Sphingomonas ginkgonis]RST30689.1 response regulator [Sphingomonas ginkgonis]